ncbi:hypothetical protein OG216_19490 [Streptomycetaceae bacterium NBC_01309]
MRPDNNTAALLAILWADEPTYLVPLPSASGHVGPGGWWQLRPSAAEKAAKARMAASAVEAALAAIDATDPDDTHSGN